MSSTTLTPRSHGRARPEVPRIDELAVGVPAPSGAADSGAPETLSGVERAADGTVRDPASAALLGQRGGRARADRERRLAETPTLARGLGLRDISVPELEAYLLDAEELAEHECARLALAVGGGICGTAPSLLVSSAALQTAGSRYSFAKGDLVTGSRLADSARANLLTAHQLVALEATARRGAGRAAGDDHARAMATFGSLPRAAEPEKKPAVAKGGYPPLIEKPPAPTGGSR